MTIEIDERTNSVRAVLADCWTARPRAEWSRPLAADDSALSRLALPTLDNKFERGPFAQSAGGARGFLKGGRGPRHAGRWTWQSRRSALRRSLDVPELMCAYRGEIDIREGGGCSTTTSRNIDALCFFSYLVRWR